MPAPVTTPQLELPQMFTMETSWQVPDQDEPLWEVQSLLKPFSKGLSPGNRIGVAVGSRGLAHGASLVKDVCRHLKELGVQVVLIPAMGSHGGATAQGQATVLAEYGITSENCGALLEPSMNTILVGESHLGTSVYWSSVAAQLDGVLVVNRIKPHTDFKGMVGSGLMKMLVVGLGKREGASAFHRSSLEHGYETILRAHAAKILETMPVLGGIAVIENARHDTESVHPVKAEELLEQEACLFQRSKALMPALPFDDIDLLIVDRMGKNLSGSGMDPNIIGRGVHGYSTHFAEQPQHPRIKRIMVRELSPESHGNAIGIGMADFTTSRLVRSMDHATTFVNAVTAMTLNGAKVPIHFEKDVDVIRWALSSLTQNVSKEARILRIRDTLNLDVMEGSVPLLQEAKTHAGLKLLEEPFPMRFDADGNCLPLRLPMHSSGPGGET